MMKRLLCLFTAFVVLISLFICPLSVFADDSNVEYTGNTGDLIFEPGSEYSPTDLFDNFKKVMPGAKLTQKITVKNSADKQVKIKLYIRSLGADEQSTDFLKQLQLTVTKDSDTPMFDAKANETDGLTDWTEIGILYSGGVVDLNLCLSVPTTLDNEYQKKIGKIKWQFMAVEFPLEDERWICPDCHESHYRIIDYDDHSEYHCESCGHTEDMLCPVCGGKMHKVIYRDEGRKVWYYYVCEHDSSHHTNPSPKTGDSFPTVICVSVLAVSSLSLAVLLLLLKRCKNSEAKRNEK